jgi:glycosyltransferase involved in cell wall biosynthesis
MRIAIYNRYWSTRGGGERYAGAMAEILSQDHRVELLGPDAVGLHGLADHLGLDLSRASFRPVPPVSERALAPLTAEYDLFVNCTYLSRLPSRARKSIYLVLFPQRAWRPGLVHLARRIAGAVPSKPSPVVPLEGFHETDERGSRWSGGTARFRVQPGAFRRGRRARIRLSVPEQWPLEDALTAVRAPGVEWRVEGAELILEREARGVAGPVDVEIECRTFVPSELGLAPDQRRLGVRLADTASYRPWGSLSRLAGRVEGRIDSHDPQIPASYDLLLAISEFTRRWISRRWDQPSEVLAPPVDTATFTAPDPREKERVILSVGRFFHGSHNKKHLEMLRVFRRMHDRGAVPDGWEYHLAGNLHRDRLVDLEYFAELERLAEGYPVKLLVDLDLEQLVERYRRAAIFWHAAGWGESERRRPEKFEHFGLTTCEAMSSGCIPVVIAKAGQLEIVEHGESGFLFTTADELATLTSRLIKGHGEPWTHEIMRRAVSAVERFARPRFEERLWEILKAHDFLT